MGKYGMKIAAENLLCTAIKSSEPQRWAPLRKEGAKRIDVFACPGITNG